MALNRYKKLRQYLHFNDNWKLDDTENKKIYIYKIQPIIDYVRNSCLSINLEIENSINEQIILA